MTDVGIPASRHQSPAKDTLWRGMDLAELDRAYDNTGAVKESGDFIADWTARSADLRARYPDLLDLPYGPKERNKLDILRSGAPNAPLLVFIHGGYWQRNSKDVFTCMAEGLLGLGVDVALPGYTLGPDATLGEIMSEIESSLIWLRREGPSHGVATGRLIVSGWSAGGHLAASVMHMPQVNGGLAISGIFDLEPIQLGSLNIKLGLTTEDIRKLSPIHNLPPKSGTLVAAYGTSELRELQRQSQEYAEAWKRAGFQGHTVPVKDKNHFSILEELARPGGALAMEVVSLIRQS